MDNTQGHNNYGFDLFSIDVFLELKNSMGVRAAISLIASYYLLFYFRNFCGCSIDKIVEKYSCINFIY